MTTTLTVGDLDQRAEQVLADLDVDANDHTDTACNDDGDPFLLVQHHRHDGDIYATRHESLDFVGEYLADEEDAGTWDTVEVVDLRDGSRYSPRVTVTFDPDVDRGTRTFA